MAETYSDDAGFELLPIEDVDLVAASEQLEAAEASISDNPFAPGASAPAPVPFGRSWEWDPTTERYARTGTMTRQTGQQELIRTVFEEGSPFYVIAPDDEDTKLLNPGTVGTQIPEAVLSKGAVLQSPGLIDGGAEALLDGTDDFVDTLWMTRRNMVHTPYFLGGSVGVCLNDARCSVATKVLGGTIGGEALAMKTIEVAAANTFGTRAWVTKTAKNAAPAAPGVAIMARATVTVPTTRKVGFFLRCYKADGTELAVAGGSNSAETEAPAGVATVAFGAWTTPAETAFAALSVCYQGVTIGEEIFWDAIVMEQATKAEYQARGGYFPKPAEFVTGLAGWSGTARESLAEKGPLPRGASRTFIFALRLTEPPPAGKAYGVFGSNPTPAGGASSRSGVYLHTNGSIFFRIGNGTEIEDRGFALNYDQKVHVFAVVWNWTTKVAKFYQDGVLKAITAAYTKELRDGDANTWGIGTFGGGNPYPGAQLPWIAYNGELTAEQILAISEAGLSVPEPVGAAPAEVRGTDALRQWIYSALQTAQGAHAVFPGSFGIENPDDWIGVVDPTDALVTFEPRANDALKQHDRIEELDDLTAEYDPDEGVISIEDLVVVTDEQEAVPLTEVELTPNY